MKTVFVTFADNKYKKSLIRIEDEVKRFSCFTDFFFFQEKDIEKNYLKIIKPWFYRRGYGYWRWKPYFVKKVLDKLDEGDVLIWSDAGCILNSGAEEILLHYIEMARSCKSGFFVFEQKQIEREWTKNDLFEYLQTDYDDRNSGQFWAGAWIVVKTNLSQDVIDQWYDICRNHEDLVTDKRSETPNDENFQEHRWDQSVFSLVVKATDDYVSIPYTKDKSKPIIGARKKEPTRLVRLIQYLLLPWRIMLGLYLKYGKGFYFKNKMAW